MIQIEKVSFSYNGEEKILKNVDLEIEQGECILLCGESGCGKTTVTKLINGLIPHFMEDIDFQGTVNVDRYNISETESYELAKYIGSVFQNPKSQFFNLDTDSELAFGLENEGKNPDEMQQRIDETIDLLGIHKLLHRNIFSLSGGEKQTLAFASVFAMRPAVYVLDEPSANLDLDAIEKLREQIHMLKKQGHTVIIAEHRLYFLSDIIDRAVYFKEGSIEKIYTREEFRALDDMERKQKGLREIVHTSLELPVAERKKAGNGLYVEKLTCGYKKETAIIRDMTFCAMQGEILAVTGANGVGKTTLTRCLCGLIKERVGNVFLGGQRLKVRERQEKCFLVMQDVNHQLFFDSVWNECVQAGGNNEKEIEDVLQRLGLLEFKERHPMALSGGQKQRLAVATALLSQKEVLIFDEPTSGLDYRHMVEVGKVLRMLANQGKIVIVISHDREFMQLACDRILVM